MSLVQVMVVDLSERLLISQKIVLYYGICSEKPSKTPEPPYQPWPHFWMKIDEKKSKYPIRMREYMYYILCRKGSSWVWLPLLIPHERDDVGNVFNAEWFSCTIWIVTLFKISKEINISSRDLKETNQNIQRSSIACRQKSFQFHLNAKWRGKNKSNKDDFNVLLFSCVSKLFFWCDDLNFVMSCLGHYYYFLLLISVRLSYLKI